MRHFPRAQLYLNSFNRVPVFAKGLYTDPVSQFQGDDLPGCRLLQYARAVAVCVDEPVLVKVEICDRDIAAPIRRHSFRTLDQSNRPLGPIGHDEPRTFYGRPVSTADDTHGGQIRRNASGRRSLGESDDSLLHARDISFGVDGWRITMFLPGQHCDCSRDAAKTDRSDDQASRPRLP